MTLVGKRLSSLGVLVLVAGGGYGVVRWTDARSEANQKAEEADKKVLAFTDATTAREVRLTTDKGSFTLVHEAAADGSARWVITEPVHAGADGGAVDGLLGALSTLSRTGKVSGEGAKDLGLFGLEHPRLSVEIKDATGKSEVLQAGKKNGFDGSFYVKRPEDAFVSLVNGGLEYQLDKDLFALRDKALVSFDQNAVERVAVELGGKPAYTLAKTEQSWKLTAPRELPADSVQVAGLLSALSGVTAKSFVSESPAAADLKQAGLDKPTARVTLGLAGKGELVVLLSEQKSGATSRWYAAVASGGPLFELSSDWALGKVKVAPDDLRDLHVASFDRNQVGTLVITKGDVSLSFTRTQTPEGETWEMTAPEKKKAQAATLAGVVYRLWSMKAKHVVFEKAAAKDLEKAGLDKPAAVVEMKKADGTKLARFVFGKLDAEQQYVSGDGARIDQVDKSFEKELSIVPAEYAEEATADAKAP